MADLSYAQAHAAASKAIATLGYLVHDEFERHVFVDQILEAAVSGGRFVHNRQKAASKKQVDKEISDLINAAQKITKIIDSLHGTTFEKLSDSGVDPNEIDLLCARVASACKHLVDTTDIPDRLPKSKTRQAEQRIAEILAEMFTRSTGRPASVTWDNYKDKSSGDFLNLVQAVFDALEIRSSALGSVDYVRRLQRLPPDR